MTPHLFGRLAALYPCIQMSCLARKIASCLGQQKDGAFRMVECECRVSHRLPMAAILAPKLSLVLDTPFTSTCGPPRPTIAGWGIARCGRRSRFTGGNRKWNTKRLHTQTSKYQIAYRASQVAGWRLPLFYTSGLKPQSHYESR